MNAVEVKLRSNNARIEYLYTISSLVKIEYTDIDNQEWHGHNAK